MISNKVITALHDRAGGFCEACLGPLGWLTSAVHHRKLRSQGGGHELANLMLVHGDLAWNCHNLTEYSIHQNPTRSYRLGHMVRSGADPANTPLIPARDLRSLRS